MSPTASLTLLSLFCAGGLYAYLHESRRLVRLIREGCIAPATVRKKQKIDSGSESVIHYLVTWEFAGPDGKPIRHEEDMNSAKFFDGIAIGDVIPILYAMRPRPTSYALSQVRRDLWIARGIAAMLVVFWLGLGLYFLRA